MVDRYKRHKADLTLTFIDPDSQPEKTRELNIDAAGIIIVEYQGRTEKLNFIDESSLTNALLQLANADERWVTFLTGHGERAPDGIANFDLGQFGKELDRRKIKAQALNLATMPDIPSNSALLVITAPAVPLLPGEIELIKRYIQQGGNLLLLSRSGQPPFGRIAANPRLAPAAGNPGRQQIQALRHQRSQLRARQRLSAPPDHPEAFRP